MNNPITEKTKELLMECKKAGYKIVAVLVKDRKVPQSMSIKMGSWAGLGTINSPYKIISGCPERLGEIKGYPGNAWPRMRGIARELDLCGINGGYGLGDSIDIHKLFVGDLTPGCYDLSKYK